MASSHSRASLGLTGVAPVVSNMCLQFPHSGLVLLVRCRSQSCAGALRLCRSAFRSVEAHYSCRGALAEWPSPRIVLNPVQCPLAVESAQLKSSGRLSKKPRIPFMQVNAELPSDSVLVSAPSSQTSTRCGTLVRRRTRTPEQTLLRKRFPSRMSAPLELKSSGLKL